MTANRQPEIEDQLPQETIAAAAEEERGVLEPLEPASKRAGGPVARPVYTTGNAELDRLVDDTIKAIVSEEAATAHAVASQDLQLTREMLTSSLRLITQHANRAELKMVNAALKEFAYSFRLFAPYRHLRKVSIFGSARVQPGEPSYIAARDFAKEMARRGWMVITGAGPGIMAAGHEGAGAQHSFGVNIQLPGLNPANIYIANDGKLINFKYFFTRKVTFMKESTAFVLMPGGFGTLDETFELLTLVQTGKSELRPIVLLEVEGSTYWDRWLSFVHEEVLEHGFVLPSDLSIFRIVSTPEQAVQEIERFYSNYQSSRFVGERFIMRLKHAPSPDVLTAINRHFADLLDHGEFEVIGPTPPEIRDKDALDCERLAFYPQHHYGRIRELVDYLNAT